MIKKIPLIYLLLTLVSCFPIFNQEPQSRRGSNDNTSNRQTSYDDLYDDKPDVSRGYEGILKRSEKMKVLKRLNKIRKIHGLLPVQYNVKDDIRTQKCSLIIASNAQMSHFPPKNWRNWSKLGYEGCSRSNILIWNYSRWYQLKSSEQMLDIWLVDNNVDSLGHRLWLLSPYLKYVSFGRVDGVPLVSSSWPVVSGSAISVVNTKLQDITGTKTRYIAYPYHNYPSKAVNPDWYMHFTIVKPKISYWQKKNVSFDRAKVYIRDDQNRDIQISSTQIIRKHYYGTSDILKWKVNDDLRIGTKYFVTIKKVLDNGKLRSYSYWFRLR